MQIRGSHVTINPSHMTHEARVVLSYFLRYQSPVRLKYDNDQAYRYPGLMKTLGRGPFELMQQLPYCTLKTISLTHLTIKRPRHSDPDIFCYDVYGETLGQGGSGQVRDIIGTLHEGSDGLFACEQHVHHAGKIIQVDADLVNCYGSSSIAEYAIGKLVPYMHIHSPVIFSSETHDDADWKREHNVLQEGVVVMRYLSGFALHEIIHDNTPVDKRLKVAAAALHGLALLHRLGIAHRDIKPDNMKVIEIGPWITVRWFDFEYASLSMNSSEQVCSPFYESPEFFQKQNQTRQSDLFSLGCLIARDIFNARKSPAERYYIRQDKKLAHTSVSSTTLAAIEEKIADLRKESVLHCEFKGLFRGKSFKGLSRKHKKQFMSVVESLTAQKPWHRMSAESAWQIIETIIWERSLKHARVAPELLSSGRFEAKLARQAIQIDPFYKKPTFEFLLDHLNYLSHQMARLTDKPEVISVFVEHLELHAFANMTTLAMLQAGLVEIRAQANTLLRLISICNDFHHQIPLIQQHFQLLSDPYRSSDLSRQLEWLILQGERVTRKILQIKKQDTHGLLNELPDRIAKLERYVNRMKPVIINFMLMVDQGCMNESASASTMTDSPPVTSPIKAYSSSFFKLPAAISPRSVHASRELCSS